MRVNRNITVISILVGGLCFPLSYFVNKTFMAYGVNYWSSILIGVLSSSIVSLSISSTTYFIMKRLHYNNLLAYFTSIYYFLGSPILLDKKYIEMNIRSVVKLREQYRQMVSITNDFCTFFPCGYIYRQIVEIHKLMMEISGLAGAWVIAEYCNNEKALELLTDAQTVFITNEKAFTSINNARIEYQKQKQKRSKHFRGFFKIFGGRI